ncbi:MAG: endonuclease [Alloprevotella sp.]|nr:endonuclease [Alloprevotella sp.]
MKKLYFLFFLLLTVSLSYAQIPANYYKAAKGKSGQALKTALCDIIYSHTQRTYTNLWADFKTTDTRDDGYIYDMYSGITNYEWQSKGATYKVEGDCYNREHSFPKSWFNDEYPMYTDLHHLIPSDGYVNGRRSNYPYGVVSSTNIKYESSGGFSKLGTNSISGYSGTVFEPNDMYKGDLARIYFYMATAYEKTLSSDWSSDAIDGSTYPFYNEWYLNMLLGWAINDPVSQKEINRNNAVYSIQKNRNPYVDFPGLEQIVWGTKTDVSFDPDNYDSSAILNGAGGYNGSGIDTGGGGGGSEEGGGGSSGGGGGSTSTGNTYTRVGSTADLVDGDEYIIVCESKAKAAGGPGTTRLLAVDVSINSSGSASAPDRSAQVTLATGGRRALVNTVESETNADDLPTVFIITKDGTSYTIYDTRQEKYLALTSNANAIHTAADATSNDAHWNITVSSGVATITNASRTTYKLQCNNSTPMFRCYTSSQASLSLYHRDVVTGIDGIEVEKPARERVVYDLSGRRVKNPTHGIYIIDGKKVLVP